MIIIDSYSGKNIRRHSFFETENEVLLLPARHFEVISSLTPTPNFHIIQLREIEPDVTLLAVLPVNVVSTIDLSKQHLTDDDIAVILTQALAEKPCSQLKLSENYITDIGVQCLANLLQNHEVNLFSPITTCRY